MNTTCSHTDEIAQAIYIQHHNELHPGAPAAWASLTEQEQQAWRKVAGNLLPTLGEHALKDLLAYAKRKLGESSSTGRKILWGLASAAVLAALSWLASVTLTGCGHTVDASREDGLIICKDGTCLVIRNGHVTYGPAPVAVAAENAAVPVRQEK